MPASKFAGHLLKKYFEGEGHAPRGDQTGQAADLQCLPKRIRYATMQNRPEEKDQIYGWAAAKSTSQMPSPLPVNAHASPKSGVHGEKPIQRSSGRTLYKLPATWYRVCLPAIRGGAVSFCWIKLAKAMEGAGATLDEAEAPAREAQ